MHPELATLELEFAKFHGKRKGKRDPVPQYMREVVVGLMGKHPTFLIAEACRISSPVLYKWRKELRDTKAATPTVVETKPAQAMSFVDVTPSLRPSQVSLGASAVWEHPFRGRLTLSGLGAGEIGALAAYFASGVAQ